MNEDYGTFIFLAYGVTAMTIGVVTAKIIFEHRRLRTELARLEAHGSVNGRQES
jgi:heme exporter protein CcmD